MSNKKNTIRHVSDNLRASIMHNRGGQKVIERILSAYGFKSRQAFCNHLGISQSTMANRYARDTFPADWVLICSLETGVSVEWLSSGEDTANPKILSDEESLPLVQSEPPYSDNTSSLQGRKFPNEIVINTNEGGKAAIERLVDAYGFTTRQALADHLRISKSTLANRYLRDTFPSDWIIQCALETGTSLLWLTNGKGPKSSDISNSVSFIKKQHLIKGILQEAGHIAIDKSLLIAEIEEPIAISVDKEIYLADTAYDLVSDGNWLVEIEGSFYIKKITRIPAGKVMVSDSNSSFECLFSELKILAKCHSIFINNN
ncbi:phage repressor protein CI [Citrobacter freundii]